MTRPGRDVKTIPCEGCRGEGFFLVPHKEGGRFTGMLELECCPLCLGTGRESADVQARQHVEGRPEEDGT